MKNALVGFVFIAIIKHPRVHCSYDRVLTPLLRKATFVSQRCVCVSFTILMSGLLNQKTLYTCTLQSRILQWFHVNLPIKNSHPKQRYANLTRHCCDLSNLQVKCKRYFQLLDDKSCTYLSNGIYNGAISYPTTFRKCTSHANSK